MCLVRRNEFLFALDADTGVWRVSFSGASKSAPISIRIDRRQAIAVATGRPLFVLGL